MHPIQRRRFVRALVAFSIVASLPLAGGAWLRPTVEPASDPGSAATPSPATQTPERLQLSAFPGEPVPDDPLSRRTPSTVPWFTEPERGSAVDEWFGCAPPRQTSICVEPGLTPAEQVQALVPEAVSSVEDWRPLVEHFFAPADVNRALRVISCESRGDRWAKNPTSTASGLFQHLRSLWGPRASSAGFGGENVFEPVANVGVAAWLVYQGGGWSHWNPSRGCWS